MSKHLNKEQAETFFGILYGGQHHIPSEVKEFGYGWSVIHRGTMATYDFSELTRLVVLAHEMCIRAEISQGGPRGLKISIWKRDPEGDSMCTRHPNLEDNIKLVKRYRWPEVLPEL